MPHQRFPKVEVLSLAPYELKFLLTDTDISMANTLRRIMIAEVPILAIDLIEYYENSTVLTDEYIAHRMGLIPIRYQAHDSLRGGDCQGAFLPHRECVCFERCPRCSVEFTLDVSFDRENETRAESERMLPLTVTSRHLKPNNDCVQPAHFLNEAEQDEAHDEGVSIVKIGPGQTLKLNAVARIGISKEHAKWCPVAVASYRFIPEITFNEDQLNTLTLDQKQELIEVCPDKILHLDEVTGMISAVENAYEIATFTDDIKHCQHAMKKRAEDDDFVTVVPSSDKFLFAIETTGSMDAEEILLSAMKVLKERLNYLAQEVENLKDL